MTWHGPGQVVCYPVVDLRHHKKDLRWYVRGLEEVRWMESRGVPHPLTFISPSLCFLSSVGSFVGEVTREDKEVGWGLRRPSHTQLADFNF